MKTLKITWIYIKGFILTLPFYIMFSPILEVIGNTWYGWIACTVFTYITFFSTIMEKYVEPRINKIKKEEILKNYANGGFVSSDKQVAGIVDAEQYFKIEKRKYSILDSNNKQVKIMESYLSPKEILGNHLLGYRVVKVEDYSENDEVSQN